MTFLGWLYMWLVGWLNRVKKKKKSIWATICDSNYDDDDDKRHTYSNRAIWNIKFSFQNWSYFRLSNKCVFFSSIGLWTFSFKKPKLRDDVIRYYRYISTVLLLSSTGYVCVSANVQLSMRANTTKGKSAALLYKPRSVVVVGMTQSMIKISLDTIEPRKHAPTVLSSFWDLAYVSLSCK